MKKIAPIALVLIAFFSSAWTLGSEPTYLPTSLRITVLNDLGNPVEGVTVTIFEKEEDYNNETNPAQESGITDEKGRVTFKKLKPIVYYINAVKGDMDNYGGGAQTEALVKGKFNKSTIIIQ